MPESVRKRTTSVSPVFPRPPLDLGNCAISAPVSRTWRRVEARIGELLGETSQGARTDLTLGHDLKLIEGGDRQDFRLLARGFASLTDEEWRKSRRALVAHLRQSRLPQRAQRPDDLAARLAAYEARFGKIETLDA